MAKFNNPISDKHVTQQTWHGTFPEMLVIILKSPGPERGILESPDLWEFPSRSLDDKYRLVVVLVVLINTTIIHVSISNQPASFYGFNVSEVNRR